MAALGESGGEAASALFEGNDNAAWGPPALPGAALPPQLFESRPALAAEGRQEQRLVLVADEGQPGEAPPGRKPVSELVVSFGLLRQPTLAAPAPRNRGPSVAAQESGSLAPPAPSSATRPVGGSSSPPSEPLLVSSASQNAAQQLQDVAWRVALQQGKSRAAAAALPPVRLLPPQARLWSYRRKGVAATCCRSLKFKNLREYVILRLNNLCFLQQFETICVQVQPDQTKENERPALSFASNQSRNVTAAQPVQKKAKVLGLNVINPQIIRIEPLTGTGSHQFFLHSSSGPTIQLLLQKPLHPHGQVPADKIATHQVLNEQRNKSTTQTPSGTVVSKSPANSIANCEKKQREQKLKKNLKVKTRSGRISRPPRYKAKDYKFIKTEDLADCHQSDSDDYSELSVEEDEEGKEKEIPLFGPLTYDLRPKLFKCQTCDKSYIGKGGLARHYKLNPDHGLQESSPSSPMNQLCSVTLLEDTGEANSGSSHQTLELPQVTVTNEKTDATENGQQAGTGGGKRMSAVQQKDVSLLHLGPGRSRQQWRCGRPRNAERTKYSGRFNRPGQFPPKSHNSMPAEHHSALRRKTRLKELIQQYTSEDFMELVVPHLTAFVTVFEFLLMKVKKDDPAKILFPDVYREFEELHAMVMKMCQEYFSNPEIKEPLEIKNPKVAESLGINCNLSGVQNVQVGSSSEHVNSFGEHIFMEASGQKRAAESSDEMLLLAKRIREESLLENTNDYSSHHGMKDTTATNEEESSAANSCCRRLAKEQHESLELEVAMDCENPDLPCQPMNMGLENLQLSKTLGLDHCPSCLFSCDEMQPSVNAEDLQEKPMDANTSWNTASRPRGPEFCNCLVSEGSSQNPDLSLLEENSHNEKYQEQLEENEDSSIHKKCGT
ncbi:zinc finger protein 839 [Heteronotia binoei]|uniref:zinc finger protein 839 n=1 Tax=Heteronotia binoei TaxID=13085 RepID=UPI00292FB27E|nr:zinc finger protein 839 [Heteronotia binoei]